MLKFKVKGHINLLGLHKRTLEFTKEKDLTLRGDCIIGVGSEHDKDEIHEFIKNKIKNKELEVKCKIQTKENKDEFSFFLNPDFDDNEEIVIRKSDFISKRTLGIKSNKSAYEINRKLIKELKNKDIYMEVFFI